MISPFSIPYLSRAIFLAALIAMRLASVPPVTICPTGFSIDKKEPNNFKTSSSISLVPLKSPGSPRFESENL